MQAKKRRAQPGLSLEELFLSMQQLCNGIYMLLMGNGLKMYSGVRDRRLWSRWQDGSEEELYRSGEKYPVTRPTFKT
jgi:hypothetical protein